MGGKDSRKDSKKDSKKESGSLSKGKGKEKAVPSSSKSKGKGIPIPSNSKGKERSSSKFLCYPTMTFLTSVAGSSDDYYATSQQPASSSFAGAGSWSRGQLSEAPVEEDAEEEDPINLDPAEGIYSQSPPRSDDWVPDDTISPLRDVGFNYNTANYAQSSAGIAYSRTRYSQPEPTYDYDSQGMGYGLSTTGLESGIGSMQIQASNRGYGYGIGKQFVMAAGSAAGSYAANKGGAYGNSSAGNSNQNSTPRTYTKPPSIGGNTNFKYQNPAYEDKSIRKLLIENHFKVYRSHHYKQGRIVKLFWFEPVGDNARRTQNSPSQRGGTAIQRRVPGKVRRFVITELYDGHSIGVPIHTYGYRATTKPGCHPDTHCMIYTAPEPNYLPNETPLLNPKIRMVPEKIGEQLDPLSRLNYAKKYTIEHNFQVEFIGSIAPECSDQFWLTLNRIQRGAQGGLGGYPEPGSDPTPV